MLTEAVCRKITQTGTSIWSGWTPYPISDIWTRIVTWKLPLFQLVAQLPRPPLGAGVETAVLVHLLGDPIDSMVSMLLTLSMCDTRAKQAKKICLASGVRPSHSEYHRTWKSLAIMMVSYDECGLPWKADGICKEYRELRDHNDFIGDLQHIYDETAFCLAADRSTKTLPVAIAETFFIGGWIIALLRAASSEPNVTNWVNVEVHSIAISALYLWVPPAIGIGSIIGASQSENSIPRLLQAFEYQMTMFRGYRMRRPSAGGREEFGWCPTSIDRAVHGGVYTWKPTKWKGVPKQFGIGNGTLVSYSLCAIMVVGSSYLTAAVLSYHVPPRGPSCRHIPQSVMFLLWLMSFMVGSFLERWLRKGLFWAIFWKDAFFALANIGILLTTQWGIMNRCSCWSMWGLAGVHLPELEEVKPELMKFVRKKAPWIVFMAILCQLLFCAAVAWRYWDAVRVFVQRDDGTSNFSWREDREKSQDQQGKK